MLLNLYLVSGTATYLQVCPEVAAALAPHLDARECPGHPVTTEQRLLIKAPDAERAILEAQTKLKSAYKWIVFDRPLTRVTLVKTGETEAPQGDTLPGFDPASLAPGRYTRLDETSTASRGRFPADSLATADLAQALLDEMQNHELPPGWSVDPATKTIHINTDR